MNADHEAAVEAAKAEFLRIWREERHPTGRPVADITAAITAYLRHMRAAGVIQTTVPDEVDDKDAPVWMAAEMASGWSSGFNSACSRILANAVEVPE